MVELDEIVNSFNVEEINDVYNGQVQLNDLKKELGTKGHLLVVRGDLAYSDRLRDPQLANPKFWLYESLLESPEWKKVLERCPAERSLFDGVGYSALEALGYHGKRVGRKVVVVMAREMIPEQRVFEEYGVEVIHGDEPMEMGYVKKQEEVLRIQGNELLPLHQALRGAKALAPIGNNVVRQLGELDFRIDSTIWCMASGSCLYGIGRKIKQHYPDVKTLIVEPETERTINPSLDLSNLNEVRKFSLDKFKDFNLSNWNKEYSGTFPLHVSFPNRYLLIYWAKTGTVGFDKTLGVSKYLLEQTQARLRELNPEYNWTRTTALTLTPAIQLAEEGKNVLVMAYGKNRQHKYRDLKI